MVDDEAVAYVLSERNTSYQIAGYSPSHRPGRHASLYG